MDKYIYIYIYIYNLYIYIIYVYIYIFIYIYIYIWFMYIYICINVLTMGHFYIPLSPPCHHRRAAVPPAALPAFSRTRPRGVRSRRCCRRPPDFHPGRKGREPPGEPWWNITWDIRWYKPYVPIQLYIYIYVYSIIKCHMISTYNIL